MKKTKFDLESAQFQDQQSNTCYTSSSSNQGTIGNELLLRHVLQFVNQCKISVQKYLSLSQFGHGFNLLIYSNSIANFEQDFRNMIGNSIHSVFQQNSVFNIPSLKNHHSFRQVQEEYQILFESLLRKINHVLRQFVQLQHFYQDSVLGWQSKNQRQFNDNKSNIATNFTYSPQERANSFNKNKLSHSQSQVEHIMSKLQRSLHQKHSFQRKNTQIFKQETDFGVADCTQTPQKQQTISAHSNSCHCSEKHQTCLQEKFRQILQQKLKPSKKLFVIGCSQSQSYEDNFICLQRKIQLMSQTLRQSKQKQQRIQKIFTINRFKYQRHNQSI